MGTEIKTGKVVEPKIYAYTTPQVVKEAPHHAALGSRIQEDGLTEWKKFATTWRAYIKMKKDS